MKELEASPTCRKDIYQFLSLIYRDQPTLEILEELKRNGLLKALSEFGYCLGTGFGVESLNDTLAELEIEFSRLFVGPAKHVSPYESVHNPKGQGAGFLWGEATVEVKKFVEYYGLQFSPDCKGIPDHISVEFEFMARLIEKELNFRSDDDRENLDHCLEVERKFLLEHLLVWVPRFCDEVSKEAELPFYREISRFTKEFLDSEGKFLSIDRVSDEHELV